MKEKEALGQVKVMLREDIKKNPPKALKISCIAMIPYKSRKFRAILNLSYTIKLTQQRMEAVNNTTTKTAPQGAMDQMDHVLDHIIYALAEAEEDDIIYQGKTDVKDGFWRCVATEGQEWNFTYVLPQKEGEQIWLVIPTLLQMG